MVTTGSRASIQRRTGFETSLLCSPLAIACSSADPDLRVGGEGVVGHQQVGGRRPLPDAARGVVVAAVAGAEPPAEFAARIGRLLAERNAAEMRADADQDEPVVLLD